MTEIFFEGPIFDGRAARAAHDFCHAVADDVAQQGRSDVMSNLNASIRHPTPYYETQITVDRAGTDRIVNDRGIIYGPWLEGVGSRNATTRFKGYHSFRRAAQKLQGEVPRLAAYTLRRFLERMQ